MRAVIQRVTEAKLSINHRQVAHIGKGLVVLLGIEADDKQEDIAWLSRKMVNMRLFADEKGVMNKSLLDVQGELLLVSQFTLYANTQKGNRPSYLGAAPPAIAIPLYEAMIEALKQFCSKPVQTGVFGADMQVMLVNDGPVTILIDSKNKIAS